MKTIAEVEQWMDGAAEQFGDPSLPICQLFVRYVNGDARVNFEKALELWCFRETIREPHEFTVWLGPDLIFPLFISRDAQVEDGELKAFGAKEISRGVWALSPSLNIPGVIHGFVILYDVPTPAPWERLIILPGEVA